MALEDVAVAMHPGNNDDMVITVDGEAAGVLIGHHGDTLDALQYLSNLGAAYATLEVRKSNEVAQNLYKSLGFIKLGVRKRYYEDNKEDALIMCKEFRQEQTEEDGE